jgi:hypothetical protein
VHTEALLEEKGLLPQGVDYTHKDTERARQLTKPRFFQSFRNGV